ncbi:unnamed protein product [Caenorhabditis bovis]|uniref:SH3 domain-containing protein n=1 Tax=Caenorhabditis bovis TaxID=2654633 RepID=A0A8S1F448_9PELO|nr:unnamed protein product [Caenorhabditis bovis]
MTQVAEAEVVTGNVKDIVNRLSRDMTNRVPFSVQHQNERQPKQPQLYIGTFEYTAQQPDELTFAVGDIIEFIEDVEDGWSKGKLKSTGQIGMFPTNFVALKPPPSIHSVSSSRPKQTNDVIMRTEPKAIERTPSTVINDLPTTITKTTTFSAKPATSTTIEPEVPKMKEMARVKFLYVPQHTDELALSELDTLITIISKECGDAGWFEGEIHGKRGLFPDNFVELVHVPVATESGAKFSSCLGANRLNFVANKPPPANPPQPAVPPKPVKLKNDPIAATSSAAPPTSTATPSKNNFAALREKMSSNLKVVAPEQVASVQQKSSEQRNSTGSEPVAETDTNASGDQVPELNHVTKSRARPPKSRPMSMVLNRNRSSDESPMGRLNSPTSTLSVAANPLSTSMFVTSKETSSFNAVPSPFKQAAAISPPSSVSKPALKPVLSNNLTEGETRKKTPSPEPITLKSAEEIPIVSKPPSEFVTRAEYEAVLERLKSLENRLAAIERHQKL